LRLHRFEAIAFTGLATLLAVAAVVVAGQLDAVGYTTSWLDRCGSQAAPPACQELADKFYAISSGRGSMVQNLMGVVLVSGALLLGVVVTAREIERGTTRLAWSLSPSRTRWFVARVVPIAALVAITGILAGGAEDRLLAASIPDMDPWNSFAAWDMRGPVLAARAFFIFTLAVAVGSVMGRVMPAVIVAAMLSWVAINGGSHVHRDILSTETVAVAEAQVSPADLLFDQRFQLPDGTLIGWDRIQEVDPPTDDNWIPKYPMVNLVIPGTRYIQVSLREVGALVGGSAVALVLSGLVVARRRPG
jgi:hypothetical protein